MTNETMMHSHGYPALDGLNTCIHWLEGFISIVEQFISALSGPLLAIGLSFSLVDFLMQGSLLRNGSIALTWAIVQAAAVDAQLVLMWHRSKLAAHTRSWWAFIGFILLGTSLAFVAFGAVALQSLQQSAGLSSHDALASLGLTAVELVYARSGVAIVLACVAGWTRSVTRSEMVPAPLPAIEPISAPERENTPQGWLLSFPNLTCTFDEILAHEAAESDPKIDAKLLLIAGEIAPTCEPQIAPITTDIPVEMRPDFDRTCYAGVSEFVLHSESFAGEDFSEMATQSWEFLAEYFPPIPVASAAQSCAEAMEIMTGHSEESATNSPILMVSTSAIEADSVAPARGRYYVTLEEAMQITGRSERVLKRMIRSGEITTNASGKLRVSTLQKSVMKSAS